MQGRLEGQQGRHQRFFHHVNGRKCGICTVLYQPVEIVTMSRIQRNRHCYSIRKIKIVKHGGKIISKHSKDLCNDLRKLDWSQSRIQRGGEGHGNPLQYSCLENPMDRGYWWVTVHGVAKSQT